MSYKGRFHMVSFGSTYHSPINQGVRIAGILLQFESKEARRNFPMQIKSNNLIKKRKSNLKRSLR
jgi:hypothetical protein